MPRISIKRKSRSFVNGAIRLAEGGDVGYQWSNGEKPKIQLAGTSENTQTSKRASRAFNPNVDWKSREITSKTGEEGLGNDLIGSGIGLVAMPASLPIKATTRAGKIAIESLNAVNPFGGFKSIKPNLATQSLVRQADGNLKWMDNVIHDLGNAEEYKHLNNKRNPDLNFENKNWWKEPGSEIDWTKWNKEIPQNKELLDEYHNIEFTSKSNGTWMKNADGTAFNGMPEQFIQQQSINFKKAFPEGHNEVFRGVTMHSKELKPERSMFTANRNLAKNYSSNKDRLLLENDPDVYSGMYNLAHAKSANSLTFDGLNKDFTSIKLDPPSITKSNIERNIPFMEKQLEDHKKLLRSGVQNSDGSWSFPNTDMVYSNSLYKEGTSSQEAILNSYRERLKNIDNLVDNPQKLEEMKKHLGDETTTDDIAKYVEDKGIDYVKIKNIHDGGFGDVSIVNHRKGNYLKSLIGNNGMFDMTNPNIYKSIAPIAIGVGLASQQKAYGGSIKLKR